MRLSKSKSIKKAKEFLKAAEKIFEAASRACEEALHHCKKRSDEANGRKNFTRLVGGTGVVISILAGIATLGIGNAVGFRASTIRFTKVRFKV